MQPNKQKKKIIKNLEQYLEKTLLFDSMNGMQEELQIFFILFLFVKLFFVSNEKKQINK